LHFSNLFFPILFVVASIAGAEAEEKKDCGGAICWEIENRFRLFAEKGDFEKHLKAWNATAGSNRILAMEHVLSAADPRGWAKDMVGRLCFNDFTNTVSEQCSRDGKVENYLNPLSFATRIAANPPKGFEDATCSWRIKTTPELLVNESCSKSLSVRIPRRGAAISLQMTAPDGRVVTQESFAQPRDLLVAGLGDSFTSGEGNPDEPVHLKHSGDLGMCFRRIWNGPNFVLPTRDESTLDKSCPPGAPPPEPASKDAPEWMARRAKWLSSACHRSLYGYQLRAALALALEDPHITVTYIPLGCTGAEIVDGLFKGQRSRERMVRDGRVASDSTEAQLENLRRRLATAGRKPDLLFLTIGGNDIGFSGLVANAIVQWSKERDLLSFLGQLVTPREAEKKLPNLRANFATLRKRLLTLVGGDLSKVVFTPYGNPLRSGHDNALCGATRYGFDAHPAFGVDAQAVVETEDFLEHKLTPTLRDLAQCENCSHPATMRMRFADAHRPIFEEHGYCAKGADEPQFDVDCFRDGGTFKPPGSTDLAQPFAHCDRAPSDYAPYAARGRWTRTPNDSFLAAMTYPDSPPEIAKPAALTDAVWGLYAVVYGGALHPTAEGHAAMADAALIEARAVLQSAPAHGAGAASARSSHERAK
jgi:hypothetical protein